MGKRGQAHFLLCLRPMPRRTRIHIDGLPLHIVQRGHNRAACFFDDQDRHAYLGWLHEALVRERCRMHEDTGSGLEKQHFAEIAKIAKIVSPRRADRKSGSATCRKARRRLGVLASIERLGHLVRRRNRHSPWRASALPVDFSPVADVHHHDQETLVVDLVEDAIITDTNPPGVSSAEFLDSLWSGFIGQPADGTG